jgi:hypothetical protein
MAFRYSIGHWPTHGGALLALLPYIPKTNFSLHSAKFLTNVFDETNATTQAFENVFFLVVASILPLAP